MLSNVISFFANNSFISEDEKERIFNDIKNGDESVVELSLQGNSRIKYPASSIHSKDFYVFNSNFVATHVFDGTKGNLRKFSNVDAEIKNKAIDDINLRIGELEAEKQLLEDDDTALDTKYKAILRLRSKEFGQTLTDLNKKITKQNLDKAILPSTTIENLESQLSKLSADYELSKKQNELNADLEDLRQLSFNSGSIDFSKIDEILAKNIQQLSKEAVERKIRELKTLFSDRPEYQKSVERWLRYGKNVLEKVHEHKQNVCPLCDSDISDRLDSILRDYQGYFDETYEQFTNELRQKTREITAVIEAISSSEKDIVTLEKLHTRYEKALGHSSFEEFDFTKIKEDLSELKKALKAKVDNVQSSPSKPLKIEHSFSAFSEALLKYQTLKSVIVSTLELKKLNTNTIEKKIREIYKQIIILEFDQTLKTGALSQYKNGIGRISRINEVDLPDLRRELREELKKLKTESKSIAKYLGKMGIDHFDIDINEQQQEENIVIQYKNSTNEKNRLRNSLSEGEKTALAFAYFLSKFDNEVNNANKVSESVVVIDDPISSLDDNRLYSTASLICRNFEEVKQLIVLSHNFLFLKFFNSLCPSKINCLFLHDEKITTLPEELINFETPYFYMLRAITCFLDEDDQSVTYHEAKRYLPNFIRRVLETFLSFKFSMLVNRPGGYRSPGLNEFNQNIDSTNMDGVTKKELKEKIAEISRIADTHSHGNAHHTQENFYISDPDLKTLAQNAISVIETMDSLHKASFDKTAAVAVAGH